MAAVTSLASLVLKAIHRKRRLVVTNRVGNIVQIILEVNPALQIFPGILRLRDAEQIPVDFALKIKRIGMWIVGVAALKLSRRVRTILRKDGDLNERQR